MAGIEERLSRRDKPFEEAVRYFKGRVPVTEEEFYSLAEKYRGLAFTVSGYTKAQVLKRFYDELVTALEEGNTLGEFRERMNDFLEAEGYEGLRPLQADNIFRTNVQTAYNAGHYARMTDPAVMRLRPYWQYDAVNDSHTRPSHLAMDGRVWPADHPVWDTWFPPNGFRCRCTVRTLSKEQAQRRGLRVETDLPAVAPDPHFGTNPGKMAFRPDLRGYPEPLKKAFQAREAARREVRGQSAGPAPEQPHTEPQTAPQRRTEAENATEEYIRRATPGVGEITYDDGYKPGKHEDEIRVAEWLRDTFGGDIHCYNERGFDSASPDYLWNGKSWELKNPSTATSTDNAIRKALKQIQGNPGGIILDYREHEITEEIMSVISQRIERGNLAAIDVIYLRGDNLVKILRYKK